MILQTVVLYLTTSLLLLATLLLVLWLIKGHWYNIGQDPDWKRLVLSLFVLFPAHSLFAFLLYFTRERHTPYLESFLFPLNAFSLYQVFQLFLFLFNKQSGHYFQDHAYARIEIKKDSQQGYLPETIRAKTNYCFIQCVGFLLSSLGAPSKEGEEYQRANQVNEAHPLLVYGAKFLGTTEILLTGQLVLSLIMSILTLSLGHLEHFARYYFIVPLFSGIVALASILWIGLFLIVVERVIHIYRPRFKLFIISLPILSTFLLVWIFPQSLASFTIQMEQIFLLISTLWIFSSDEHSQILAINTNSV